MTLAKQIEELAGKATPGRVEIIPYGDGDSLVIHEYGTENRICFMATPSETGSVRKIEARADLIEMLWNNLPTIIAALKERDRLRSALELCAALPLLPEMVAAPEGSIATPEDRIAVIGRNRKRHDDAILSARAALKETNNAG